MSQFETYVAQELPRRPVLLTYTLTGYDGDPNGDDAPSVVQHAPAGTFFLRASDNTLWYKRTGSPNTWTELGEGGGGGSVTERFQAELLGDKNGANLTFQTPEHFRLNTERVYRNGQRLMRGLTWDYVTQEGAGPGTGWNTIVLNTQPGVLVAPIADESLFADYALVA